jgi:hypothetical protein
MARIVSSPFLLLLLLWNDDSCDGLLQQQQTTTGSSSFIRRISTISMIVKEHDHYSHGVGCRRQPARAAYRRRNSDDMTAICMQGENADDSSPSSSSLNHDHDKQEMNTTTKKNDDSWSHLLSSPEKYAHALNMTLAQVQDVKAERKRAVQELQDELSCIKKHTKSSNSSCSCTSSSEQCHFLVCQHRF